MSLRLDEEWLREYAARGGKYREIGKKAEEPGKPKRTNKYNAKRTTLDGVTYASKHEAEVGREMKLRGASGEFQGLAMQVTFYLPGGVKYIADFVTLNHDGSFTVYDAKGKPTETYRLKRKQMKECLGIQIKEV